MVANAAPEPREACDAVYNRNADEDQQVCCNLLLSDCRGGGQYECYVNITHSYFPELYKITTEESHKSSEAIEEQVEVIKKQNRVGKKQNDIVKIDEEMAAFRVEKQRASDHSSKLPKPNRKLPALIDNSGSSKLRDPLLDRAIAPNASSLKLQASHDQSAESLDNLDKVVLGKCTTD
jgi:hypothetical protein